MTIAVHPSTEALLQENILLKQQLVYLEEQLAWLKRQIFGKKSEKIVANLSELQFEFAGTLDLPKEPPKTIIVERKLPQKDGPDAIKLPKDLPVETTTLDLPEEEKVCKETGKPLVKIGEEVTQKLAHKPGSFYIKEIIRPKYAVPGNPDAGIQTSLLPDAIIPKCRADESFLAEIVTRKFADHLPLYRVAEGLNRDKIHISRKLLSQWTVRLGTVLAPLHEVMLKKALALKSIHVDETPVDMQVKGGVTQTYIWVVVGGPYRVYNFFENRAHVNLETMIGSYKGLLHSDKYGAYETYAKRDHVIWCPCWAHIRRKFFEAGEQEILEEIGKLFEIERMPDKERTDLRQKEAIPLIDQLTEKIQKRLIEGVVLPKSKLREALGYYCNLVPYLKNYIFFNGCLDNNIAERAIRPLAIGRKNWLFFGSEDGGKSAAILLSLVQTCRNLDINPRDYLEDLFRRFMSHPMNKLEELLPDQWLHNHTHPITD
jgi:transposase